MARTLLDVTKSAAGFQQLVSLKKLLCTMSLIICMLNLSACVTYGTIENQPLADQLTTDAYSIMSTGSVDIDSDTAVLLAFSGGGIRASALAYGVLKALRDTPVPGGSDNRRLLDEVRGISAVSGGSFTAAYYGLFGDGLFTGFESDFLRRDMGRLLWQSLWNPLHWFSRRGRTDFVTDYYDKYVFKGATFADLKHNGGPMILINASDLGRGTHFTFVQEYFDLLCSDLSSFPVSRAVVASSAVPLVLHPVVLKRYGDCNQMSHSVGSALAEQALGDAEIALLLEGLSAYQPDDEQGSFVHLVDGGISDNLGLRALYEIMTLSGGARSFFHRLRRVPPRRIVVISVNAGIRQQFAMNESSRRPTVAETMVAMSDLQLRRYSATTLNLIKTSLSRWSEQLSEDGNTTRSWLIELDFSDVASDSEREILNAIPTTLSLGDRQIDQLVKAGQQLLTLDETFQSLLLDLTQ